MPSSTHGSTCSGLTSDKEALVAEIKTWLGKPREFSPIFQNLHSDVQMISQTYAHEGMPDFVMPPDARQT
eukprot:COSAG06_NODE_19147_length_851_cov_1.797872_1_plen_70_part_00